MNEFLEEILSQAQALKDTFEYLKAEQHLFKKITESFKERKIDRIIFTGMGSSFFSSYIPYYLLNQNGFSAEMRESGEFLFDAFPSNHYNFFENIAIVLISQSGESGEVVELLKRLNSGIKPPLTISVTNSPNSTLTKGTDISLLTKAGNEKSVTSKTYTCTLLLLYIFAQNLLTDIFENQKELSEIEKILKVVHLFLDDHEKIDIFYNNLLSFYGTDIEALQFLSRGPSLSTAYQGALNYKEIVKGYSEANPISTFNHGCIECLNNNSKIVIISSGQNYFNLNIHFINKILTKWECGKILHITNRETDDITLNKSPKIIAFKHEILNPFLAPIMEIIILQLFFYKIAEKQGIIPGKFRFTQKITRDL